MRKKAKLRYYHLQGVPLTRNHRKCNCITVCQRDANISMEAFVRLSIFKKAWQTHFLTHPGFFHSPQNHMQISYVISLPPSYWCLHCKQLADASLHRHRVKEKTQQLSRERHTIGEISAWLMHHLRWERVMQTHARADFKRLFMPFRFQHHCFPPTRLNYVCTIVTHTSFKDVQQIWQTH